MWIIHAILFHIVLLGSIFVIYFRSPVITGLSPQQKLQNPPADRLVLIVTDGLRAESFFKNQCTDIPHIRQLIRSQGLVGVSKTRVPTESRPGHIALIAGLYEDPSAVLRGWKANPIDFDNVFNRSDHTYAWGAMEVLHIFSKITNEKTLMIDAYDEYDFTGSDKSSGVDQWVFEKVRLFLKRKSMTLKSEKGVVFFLHLLGLDIAGHIHKPGSELFLETLHKTEKGVYEMYELFEKTFPDQRTAYILTSDHGMTNHGSHGAGDPLETETPILVWGAGVNNWKGYLASSKKTIHIDGVAIPLISIEQGQVAPLMSSLIGLPPPMNSFGKLPKEVLNVSSEYMASASYINALQLVAQFEALLEDLQRGALFHYLPSFQSLDSESIGQFRQRVSKSLLTKNFKVVIEESYTIMQEALDGIEYYHTYYQNVLLLCTSLSLFIWMFCLITFFVSNKHTTPGKSFIRPAIIGLLLLAFILVERIPFEVGFYMLVPVFMWCLAIQSSCGKKRWLRSLLTTQNLAIMLVVGIGAVLMVISFFKRQSISLVFVLFALLKFRSMIGQGVKFYVWLTLSLVLSTFPLLSDALGQKNDILLLIGAVLTISRGVMVKSNLPKWIYAVAVIGLINAMMCVSKHSNLEEVPLLCRIISWMFLVYSLFVPFCVNTVSLKAQVEVVFFSLCTGYILLCTNYEAIFVVFVGSQLMLSFSNTKQQSPFENSKNDNFAESFEYALAILLYTLFTFFGIGNTASVSSFDPNVMRCFITTFSPFIIMGLVVLKLFLPLLLSVTIIYGTVGPVLDEKRVFIALLFICDIMGLNFLYLVRNKGSWLEIGSSISHFVIMEVTTLVLVATTYIVKMYLRMPKTIGNLHEGNKIK